MTKEKPSIWAEYQKRVEKTSKLDFDFKKYNSDLLAANEKFKEDIGNFKRVLRSIPLGVVIEDWLQGIPDPIEYLKQYKDNILAIIDAGVFKIINDDGTPRTVNDLNQTEHFEILNNIRCMSDYSVAQRQKMVEAYVVFSQHLSRQTCGLIQQGEDPDFHRTLKRVVRFPEFTQFIQHLSDRDALIAKLLYFGAPTLEGVLNLQANQVNVNKREVKYEQFTVRYPKHIVLELKNYLSKKGKADLVFVNQKGAGVERTHINNCFGRASRKLNGDRRITPRDLLRSDIAQSTANEFLFSSDPRLTHMHESV